MWDSAKTPEESEAESFFENVANTVHGLFYPPAPASNMALFRKRITEAIKRRHTREVEAKKATARNRFEFLRPPDPELANNLRKDFRERCRLPADDRARLLKQLREHRERRRVHRKNRQPDSRSKWKWEAVTHPDTGKVREGWIWEGMGLVIALSVLRAETPEESLPCLYLELAIIHDLTDENSESDKERHRPPRRRLLDGFDLPEEIAGEPGATYIRIVGDYSPGWNRLTDERRRDIERALDDVRADLAAAVPEGGQGQEGGITVAGAETVSGINRGTILRAAKAGKIKNNGLDGRDRRLDAEDFARWCLDRAKGGDKPESDAEVERKFRKANRA